ncbi:MAG: cellulose-binding protein CttA-related protein [Ruminococcus sp.]|nr:cellulose-binding protein CttA-related protein [Ruminococcus sp.]
MNDLFESIVLIETDDNGMVTEADIINQIYFNNITPYSLYNQETAYTIANIQAYYNNKIIEYATPTIYIGVKGDVDLNGNVSVDDASKILNYYAKVAAGLNFLEYAFYPDDEILNNFAYFLADIDTESKIGHDTADMSISVDDASYVSSYYAKIAAELNIKWDEIINNK